MDSLASTLRPAEYKIVKPHATRDEIDAAFDSGNQQPEIFTQQILQGPGHAAARNALADIQVSGGRGDMNSACRAFLAKPHSS